MNCPRSLKLPAGGWYPNADPCLAPTLHWTHTLWQQVITWGSGSGRQVRADFWGIQNCMQIDVNMDSFSLTSSCIDL